MKFPKTKSAAPSSVNELLSQVDDHRERLSALRQDRAAVDSAPRVLDDVLLDLDAHLDTLATSAIDGLAIYGLRDRRGMSGLKLSQSGHASVETATLLGLLVAVAREPLRQIIVGQLEDLDATRPGMVDADRTARLAEIDKEILAAELAEEAALRALERLGVSIARRSDLSPVVALAADAALGG